MKKRNFTLLSAIVVSITMMAQTITVTNADGTTRQINASEAGTMTYSQTDGTLTVG